MKKLFVVGVLFVLALSSCGGGDSKSDSTKDSSASGVTAPAASVDKNATIVGFLTESSCVLAKYDGDVPSDINDDVYEKYGIADDAALSSILKLVGADTASVKEQTVTKIKAQCNDLFEKSGVDPGALIDSIFEHYAAE